MTEHIKTRRRLKAIPLVADFEAILGRCTLSEEEKEILRRYYIEKQDFRFIGDALGYTERTMKDKHKKILAKISKAF